MTRALLVLSFLLQSLTPEVIEHAQAGVAALKEGRLDAAIQEFRKVTQLQPESASGHANLGEAYFQKGNYGEAIPELERALQINPNLMGAHQTLGVALLVQGDAEKALPHLEKTRMPELVGLAYLETGRLGSAVAALQAALERQPKDPDVLYYFGRATILASKATADQLAKVAPDFTKKTEAAKESRPQEDLVELQKALAQKLNDPEYLASFSRTAAEASKGAFDLVLQSSPDSARAHQILAERHAEGGRLSDAEREYLLSLSLKPYTSRVHLALADVFAAEGKWVGAITHYRMEAELRPASPDASYRLGLMLLERGQAGAALEEFARADRVSPNTPAILLLLGKAALAANDPGRAESSWKKLLEVDKDSDLAAEAHFQLAKLYRSTGRSEEADRETAAYQKLKDRKER